MAELAWPGATDGPTTEDRRGGPTSGRWSAWTSRRATRRTEGVALVTLDQRETLNALSFALLAQLDGVLAVLDADPACRAIVITGAGTVRSPPGRTSASWRAQTPELAP